MRILEDLRFGGFLVAAVLVLGACGGSGAIMKWGYDRPKYGFRIPYKNAARQQFINADWRVDNFFSDATGEWSRKRGSDYYGIRLVEDERRGGVKQENVFFFELKLNHRRTNGVIWVQVFELQAHHKDKQLDVLLNNYAESLSGSGLFVQGNVYGLLTVKEKKHAAMVRSKKRMRLQNYPALGAKIEILNLDRVKVDPKHRGQSVELVLLRFWWTSVRSVESRKTPGLFRERRFYHPAIMVIGYKNTAAYFDKHRPDFQSFLGRLRFKSHRKRKALPVRRVSPPVRRTAPPPSSPPARKQSQVQPPPDK